MQQHFKTAAVAAFIGLVPVVAVLVASRSDHDLFRAVWCLHLFYGLPIALACGACAAGLRQLAARLALLLVGVVSLWISLFLGLDAGFRALQTSANPPEGAFNDGGPMMGALLLGWLPAAVLVGLAFLASRLRARRAARWATPA
jgi:hypothetical protein